MSNETLMGVIADQEKKIEELEKKLTRAEYDRGQWCSDFAAKASKLEIARDALKTIKHTGCDTYRVAADALHRTK